MIDLINLPADPAVSEAKLAANRQNALKSTGPTTPEGKRRSCLNALRAGTHAQIVCLPEEDLTVFNKLLADVRAKHQPDGPIEEFHSKSIAEAMFRMERIRSIENGIFASGFRAKVESIDAGHPEVDASLAVAATFLEQAHQISLLSTYESRLQRSLEKHAAQLKALQQERLEAYAKALKTAAALTEHARKKGEVYEPGDDFLPASKFGGFEFSAEEVARQWDRACRVDAAFHQRALYELNEIAA
jgi:hypothetical protein